MLCLLLARKQARGGVSQSLYMVAETVCVRTFARSPDNAIDKRRDSLYNVNVHVNVHILQRQRNLS